jgi:hypothetical protein
MSLCRRRLTPFSWSFCPRPCNIRPRKRAGRLAVAVLDRLDLLDWLDTLDAASVIAALAQERALTEVAG